MEVGAPPTGFSPRSLPHGAHRRLIGVLGFLLPLLLLLFAGLFPTEGLPRWAPLPTLSAYYYTGASGVFCGILFSLSLFLFTYSAYSGKTADRAVGTVGGIAALGVALCPTHAPFGLSEPSWWGNGMRLVHYASAVVLFTAFIIFSLWLFRKSLHRDRTQRSAGKKMRDSVCLVCGIVMIVSVLWAGSSMLTGAPIFVPEALAVMAFAVSWLVKGRAIGWTRIAVKRVMRSLGDRRESDGVERNGTVTH